MVEYEQELFSRHIIVQKLRVVLHGFTTARCEVLSRLFWFLFVAGKFIINVSARNLGIVGFLYGRKSRIRAHSISRRRAPHFDLYGFRTIYNALPITGRVT